MKISVIAAIAENNGIGLNNQLLWHLPDDLQFFKKTTLNSSIIMGRKTFQSIGKALPKRQNIVVSRNPTFEAPGCILVNNLQEGIAKAESEEVFIVGGASIYQQALIMADKLYITHVHHTCQADTFFPIIDEKIWKPIFHERHQKDDKHAHDFTFVIYEKSTSHE